MENWFHSNEIILNHMKQNLAYLKLACYIIGFGFTYLSENSWIQSFLLCMLLFANNSINSAKRSCLLATKVTGIKRCSHRSCLPNGHEVEASIFILWWRHSSVFFKVVFFHIHSRNLSIHSRLEIAFVDWIF